MMLSAVYVYVYNATNFFNGAETVLIDKLCVSHKNDKYAVLSKAAQFAFKTGHTYLEYCPKTLPNDEIGIYVTSDSFPCNSGTIVQKFNAIHRDFGAVTNPAFSDTSVYIFLRYYFYKIRNVIITVFVYLIIFFYMAIMDLIAVIPNFLATNLLRLTLLFRQSGANSKQIHYPKPVKQLTTKIQLRPIHLLQHLTFQVSKLC